MAVEIQDAEVTDISLVIEAAEGYVPGVEFVRLHIDAGGQERRTIYLDRAGARKARRALSAWLNHEEV